MPIIASAGANRRDFQPAPEGVHAGVCVDVTDLGLLEVTWDGESRRQHKVQLAWQIAEDRADNKPYLVTKRYTLSLHLKSRLRTDLESWRGKTFSSAEEAGFDLESIIGANCLLNIQHRQAGDRVFANVIAIMPLPKGMAKLEPRDYIRKQDRPVDAGPSVAAVTADEIIPF